MTMMDDPRKPRARALRCFLRGSREADARHGASEQAFTPSALFGGPFLVCCFFAFFISSGFFGLSSYQLCSFGLIFFWGRRVQRISSDKYTIL